MCGWSQDIDNIILRNMSEKAGICPYYTQVTRFEPPLSPFHHPTMLKHGKSKLLLVTGELQLRIHSYCERLILSQFKQMSSTPSSLLMAQKPAHCLLINELKRSWLSTNSRKNYSCSGKQKPILEKGEFQPSVLKTNCVQCPASIMLSGH